MGIVLNGVICSQRYPSICIISERPASLHAHEIENETLIFGITSLEMRCQNSIYYGLHSHLCDLIDDDEFARRGRCKVGGD